MNIAQIIWQVIKTVPQLYKLYAEVQELYYKEIFDSIGDEIESYKTKRRALSASIQNAKTEEERKALSIMLHDLRVSSKLSNDSNR